MRAFCGSSVGCDLRDGASGREDDFEVRQFFRLEIERRRVAEQELKLLKNGLKTIPGVQLSMLLEPERAQEAGICAKDMALRSETSAGAHQALVSLVERLADRAQLRHLGLKEDRGDILSFSGSVVVSEVEMQVLCVLAGREWG